MYEHVSLKHKPFHGLKVKEKYQLIKSNLQKLPKSGHLNLSWLLYLHVFINFKQISYSAQKLNKWLYKEFRFFFLSCSLDITSLS
jgi:hypothetical protein